MTWREKKRQYVTNVRNTSLVYIFPVKRLNASFFRLSREIERNGCGSHISAFLLKEVTVKQCQEGILDMRLV